MTQKIRRISQLSYSTKAIPQNECYSYKNLVLVIHNSMYMQKTTLVVHADRVLQFCWKQHSIVSG